MYSILAKDPWLIVVLAGAVVAIACTAITIISDYLRKTQQAEIDASLKHAMLERGMSAADIKLVLESTSDAEAIRGDNRGERVSLGCGEFRLEIGSRDRTPAQQEPLPL